MPKFNTNQYELADLIGFDPLFGDAPLPEETRYRDLHTIPNPRPNRHDNIRAVTAGRRTSAKTRVSGGAFAPRATSGMS